MIWWKEVLIFGIFYSVYTLIRNQFGSTLVEGVSVPNHSFTNAIRVIRFERWIGLYHEETLQDWVLPHIWLIKTMNVYYGTAHFFVTLGVFVALYKFRPSVFGQWRNTLAVMTALAIIGFSLFPLMPPRLLDAPCPDEGFGAACIENEYRNLNGAENFGFVDTIREYGGPWAFDRVQAAKYQINMRRCLRYISVGQHGAHSDYGQSRENFGCVSHFCCIQPSRLFASSSLAITSGSTESAEFSPMLWHISLAPKSITGIIGVS